MITLRSQVSADGLLHLTLPVKRFSTKEVEVTVIVNPLPKVKPFPVTRLEDGLGCVGYKGPAKSLEEMEAGILREARRQWLTGNQE